LLGTFLVVNNTPQFDLNQNVSGVAPDVTHARFMEMFDFLVYWGEKFASWSKHDCTRFVENLSQDVIERYMIPEVAALSNTQKNSALSSPSGTSSGVFTEVAERVLPVWFRDKIAAINKTDHLDTCLNQSTAPDELGRIDEYRILRQLGSGAWGVVYEAERPCIEVARNLIKSEPEKVAIKVMKPNFMNDDTVVSRFIQEAQILQNLKKHRDVNVVCFEEAKRARTGQQVLYIVMEYVKGLTLQELITHHAPNPTPCTVAVDICRQLAKGLKTIHHDDSVIIHRDLKPSNILLGRAPNHLSYPSVWHVRISDVGLAKITKESGVASSEPGAGTPRYWAPEQFEAAFSVGEQITIDAKCDIFALGIIAYQLLSGQHPFPKFGDYSTPVPIMGVPDALNQCVMKMLVKMPMDRSSAEEVYDQLENLLQETRFTNSIANGPTKSSRRWRMVLGVVASFIALIVVTLVGLVQWDAFKPPANKTQDNPSRITLLPIAGTVYDATVLEEEIPLVGVEVTLFGVWTHDGKTPITKTNEFGQYSFGDLIGPIDLHSIEVRVSCDGFHTPLDPTTQAPGKTKHTIHLYRKTKGPP
jgi:serine/threonine protein kinase